MRCFFFSTQVVYVNLQELAMIVDDIVIQIQLNRLNNVNDDSRKKKKQTNHYVQLNQI